MRSLDRDAAIALHEPSEVVRSDSLVRHEISGRGHIRLARNRRVEVNLRQRRPLHLVPVDRSEQTDLRVLR